MANQEQRISKIEKTLFGNGEPGMDENVRNLVKDVSEVKENIEKIAGHTGPTYSEMEALKRAIFEKLDWTLLEIRNTMMMKIIPGDVKRIATHPSIRF